MMQQPNVQQHEAALLANAFTVQRQGQWQQALQLFDLVLQQNPSQDRALAGRALATAKLGKIPEARRLAEQAASICPDSSGCQYVVAHIALMESEPVKAISHCERAIELDPSNTDAFLIKATCQDRCGNVDAAIITIDEAMTTGSADPSLATAKAGFLMRQKRYAEAQTTLEQITQDENLPPTVGRSAWHQLAVVRDKIGEYESAFFAMQSYVRIVSNSAQAKQCNRQTRLNLINAFKLGFTPEGVAQFTSEAIGHDEPAPAFLVGFPRSGTTLTEQVLGAHPNIATSDERGFVNQIRKQWFGLVGKEQNMSNMVGRTTIQQVQQLRRSYWDGVESAMGSRYNGITFVDKLPLNIVNLGFIKMVFPDAKIIVALRDPRDVCLSCYMQDFRLNNAMIHMLTLKDAANYYAHVMDLYLAFKERFSLSILEVRYEDTVLDLERQARLLLDHLGSSWDERVLQFHQEASDKFISTPSYAAVAEPVHTGATNRWRNYASHFQAVSSHLDRFVSAFGYS